MKVLEKDVVSVSVPDKTELQRIVLELNKKELAIFLYAFFACESNLPSHLWTTFYELKKELEAL